MNKLKNRYHPVPKAPATPEREIDKVAMGATLKAIHDQWVVKYLKANK